MNLYCSVQVWENGSLSVPVEFVSYKEKSVNIKVCEARNRPSLAYTGVSSQNKLLCEQQHIPSGSS